VLDWTAAGAPTSTQVPAMRQFTRWAQHLGGLLEHHGIHGFLGNAAENRDLDDDAAEWRAFLLRWHELHPGRRLTANELRRTAEPGMGTDPWDGTFPTLGNGHLPSVKSLGKRLTGQIGRWRGDIVLRSVTDTRNYGRLYWVEHRPTEPRISATPETNPLNRKAAHRWGDQHKHAKRSCGFSPPEDGSKPANPRVCGFGPPPAELKPAPTNCRSDPILRLCGV
jgi:hypothetical protein